MHGMWCATTAFVCAALTGTTTRAHAQRLPHRFPAAAAQPYFAHHEGPVAVGLIGTVGGSLLVANMVLASQADSSWERLGVLAFTLPFAFFGTVAGAVATPSEGNYLIAPMIGGIAGGMLGGAIGKPVGRRASRGSPGARRGVTMTGVLSLPAAFGIGMVYAVLGAERNWP